MNLGKIKCIESENTKVLFRRMRLKKGGRITFINYDENPIRGVGLNDTSLPRDILYCRKITDSDVKSALRS